jgi:two-component system, NarL family, response regulator YdfI
MIEVVIMAPLQSRREWLEQVFRAESSIHIARSAATFPFLRSLIHETTAEAAVIDLGTTVESEVVHDWLLELLDVLPLVLLTSNPDSWMFNAMLHAERGALLRADASGEQIVRSIQSIAAGLVTLDSSLAPQSEAAEDPAEELTPREIDVLRLLAEGIPNREIATRLNISEHTIKFHIRSILGKLGASTRTEAVTRGFRAGLIEL